MRDDELLECLRRSVCKSKNLIYVNEAELRLLNGRRTAELKEIARVMATLPSKDLNNCDAIAAAFENYKPSARNSWAKFIP